MRTILLILSLTFWSPNIINAQNNVAKIDINKLIEEYPGKDEYVKDIEELSVELQTKLDNMYNKLSDKIKKYDSEAELQSEQTNIERAKEINREKEEISKQQNIAIEQLEKFELNIDRKMSINVHNVVLFVAKKQNLDFVIDSSHGYNIIEADCKDIFNDVKQELIKYIQTQ